MNEFDNIDSDDLYRYNFKAAPYTSMTANEGHRHHFMPSKSLSTNGFKSNNAYCIRMLANDYLRTGSYGSSSSVAKIIAMLSNQQYEDAIRHEVLDLQSKTDSENMFGSLQQKYYDEVIICIYEYEVLFGI